MSRPRRAIRGIQEALALRWRYVWPCPRPHTPCPASPESLGAAGRVCEEGLEADDSAECGPLSRHSVTTTQLQEKLAGAQAAAGTLRAQEAGLQREQRKAGTHKKMTEF